MPKQVSLGSLFWTFLKIGSTAFGGFMALIAVVENMIVTRRKLLRHDDMLDGISLASMLPGPVAVNVVAFVGYRLRGFPGAAVCATGVILPSFLLIVVLTMVYFQWGQLPVMDKIFMGFLPAVSAIIINTAWGMSRKTIKSVAEGIILVAAAILLLYIRGFYITLGIIVGAGIIGLVLFRGQQIATSKRAAISKRSSKKKRRAKKSKGAKRIGNKSQSSMYAINPALTISFFSFQPELILKLLITFAGMSLMLFGGGYVFVPMIQEVVVTGYGWLTQKQFIDAIAMGQITPGPILISATFIGYKVAGFLGALSATIGIFLPPVVLMIFCTKALEKIRQSSVIQSMLRGIRPAVIGMIFAAAVVVAQSAHLGWATLVIFAAAIVALIRFRVEVVWIIPTAGLIGLALY